MPNMELNRDEAIAILTRRANRAWLKRHRGLAWFGVIWFVAIGTTIMLTLDYFEATLDLMTTWERMRIYVPAVLSMFVPIFVLLLIDSRHAAQAKREVP